MSLRLNQTNRVPLWLILVSFLAAVVQVKLMSPLKFGPKFERAAVARALAQRGEFADPFSILPTGPTTHVSPVYPIVLAGILRLFGETPAAALFLVVSCVLMHAIYPVLLFLFARELLPGDHAPIAVAAIAVVIPHFPPMIHVETIYLVNTLLLTFVLTWRWLRTKPATRHHAVFEGIFGALCTLINAAAIVIWFTWIAYLYWRQQVRGRGLLVSSAILIGTFFVGMSPWAARNYHAFGVPILLRGNLGFELSLSNRDGAAPTTLGNGRNGILARYHPNFSIAEAEILRNEGELDYNHRKLREAWDWIWRNPGSFAWLTAQRSFYFWFPPQGDAPFPYVVSLWILTLFAAFGIVRLWRDRHPFLPFALGIYLAYPALLYLIQTSIVYTLVIVWLHVLCAGYGIASIPAIRRLLATLGEASHSENSPDSLKPAGQVLAAATTTTAG